MIKYDITLDEYLADQAFGSSTYSKWYESESPDEFVIPLEDRPLFSLGKCFETMIEDMIKASNKTEARFQKCSAPGEMPDDVFRLIKSGADLKVGYVINKDGSRNKTKERFHAWLDAALAAGPGRTLISNDQFEALTAARNNLLMMTVRGEWVVDILKRCTFQTGVFWDRFGVKKKALVDALWVTDEYVVPFDFKLMETLGNAREFIKKKYWVQDQHYTEGLALEFPGRTVEPMRFLIGTKAAPHTAAPLYVDNASRPFAHDKYVEIVTQHELWIASGKPLPGFVPETGVKIFFNR